MIIIGSRELVMKFDQVVTSAVNNRVNKLILDRRSCEKLRIGFRFTPNPVFITPGIFILAVICTFIG